MSESLRPERRLLEWPDRLPGRLWLPDPDHSAQRKPPTGVVIHSGEKADRVAESALHDGRDVSYHLAHSRQHGRIVQLVSLRRRAWHAGSQGNGWIGVAIPGPVELDPRPDSQRADFRACLLELQEAFAWTLTGWCRHSDIDPDKTDPGPGFVADWMDGLGMEWRLP